MKLQLLICTLGEAHIDQSVEEMEQSGGAQAQLLQPDIEENIHQGSKESQFPDHVLQVILNTSIHDPDIETYKSTSNPDRTIVGFVLFFPNYSTFLAKAGYYVEDLYVREPYRGRGYGTILLKTVAQQALKHGAERVEWCVLDWNVNAIKFYEGLGAMVMPEWRMCRLAGDALKKCNSIELNLCRKPVISSVERGVGLEECNVLEKSLVERTECLILEP